MRLSLAIGLCLVGGLAMAQTVEDGASLDAPPRLSPLQRVVAEVTATHWERCGGGDEPVELTVERDGAGRLATLGRAPRGVEDCLGRAIEGRRAHEPGLRAGVRNRLVFPWPNRQAGFDSQYVVRGIRARLRSIQRCYEEELQRSPALAGKIVARFTLEERGVQSAARTTENTTGSAALGECITEELRSMDFGRYPTGGPVEFSYPFVFAPQS